MKQFSEELTSTENKPAKAWAFAFARGMARLSNSHPCEDRRCVLRSAKATRDPVAPAQRSDAAMTKVLSHTLQDGTPTHSFQTLLKTLEAVVRNTCRTPDTGKDAPTFEITTTPNEKQKRALELIAQIKP